MNRPGFLKQEFSSGYISKINISFGNFNLLINLGSSRLLIAVIPNIFDILSVMDINLLSIYRFHR